MPKTRDHLPSRGRGCARASLRRWSQLTKGARGSAVTDAPRHLLAAGSRGNPNSQPPDKTRVAPAEPHWLLRSCCAHPRARSQGPQYPERGQAAAGNLKASAIECVGRQHGASGYVALEVPRG